MNWSSVSWKEIQLRLPGCCITVGATDPSIVGLLIAGVLFRSEVVEVVDDSGVWSIALDGPLIGMVDATVDLIVAVVAVVDVVTDGDGGIVTVPVRKEEASLKDSPKSIIHRTDISCSLLGKEG